MKLTGNDLEVRAVSIKTSKTTGNQYIALRLEDKEGSWLNAIDRNIENKEFYAKGVIADFELNVVLAKGYASASVVSIKLKNEH